MKKLCLIIASFLVLTFFSCRKDKGDDLPKATQVGANIMAAKIDGIVWQAKACWSCIEGGRGLRTIYNSGNLNVIGQLLEDQTKMTIEIDMSGITSEGRYELGNNNSQNYARVSNYITSVDYYTTTPVSGHVTITKISELERIISGTFEFAASSSPSNNIQVMDGRFDLKF